MYTKKEEEWKTIDNPFEDYEVSNYGNVRNKNTGRLMRVRVHTSKGEQKYSWVTLKSSPTTFSTIAVHRLVAEYFIDNPDDYKFVCFINGDNSDCRSENLKWCPNPRYIYCERIRVQDSSVQLSLFPDNEEHNPISKNEDTYRKMYEFQTLINKQLMEQNDYLRKCVFESR